MKEGKAPEEMPDFSLSALLNTRNMLLMLVLITPSNNVILNAILQFSEVY